ncbi:MAG: glutaredoxin [Myxococcaceae bacterium]|jgi:glutaredoxin-related protein|nr:glutaredoxin [Myxococcaceae bacterium]
MSHPRPPLHPAVLDAQAKYHADLVAEVAAAVAKHDVVVVGVSGLQPGRRARKLLDERQVPYRYLEYGSYLSGWRRRLALKLWVGWPTFPLVFVKGTFIGGASDLSRLIASGELETLLAR